MTTKQKKLLTDSLLKTVRSCPCKYWLRYGRELVPIRTAVPLVWGSLAHDLMASLYELARDHSPGEAVSLAQSTLEREGNQWLLDRLEEARETVASRPFALDGDLVAETEEKATEILGEVLSVVGHYADTVWREDLERWQVLMVEETFQVPLSGSKDRRHPYWAFSGKWDLVVQERESGQVLMVDHKFSTRELEGLASELDSDTQPQAYLYGATVLATLPDRLRRSEDVPSWPREWPAPTRFVHNLIRRSAPSEPPLLKGRKKPTLSQAKSLLTTRELYLQAIQRHGLDISDYSETLERLSKAPHIFTMRRSPNIGPDELVRWNGETLVSARTVAMVDRLGKTAAVRHEGECRRIGRRCPYIPLCWGDEASAINNFRHEVRHVELETELETESRDSGGKH